jgi:O-antigen/teichoic acid export membrane protein
VNRPELDDTTRFRRIDLSAEGPTGPIPIVPAASGTAGGYPEIPPPATEAAVEAASEPAGETDDGEAEKKRGLSDGLSLSISGAVGSLAGAASWIIAARLMTQEDVGYASAFVSAFLMVAGIAQMNLDAGNMIWLPRAGRKTSLLYWRSHLAIVPACAVVGLVYLVFAPVMAETAARGWPIWVGWLMFVVAGIGWGLWGLHDYTMVALGKAWWASWRNIAFAVVRIGLLVGLAFLGPQGLVLSWVLPIALWSLGSALVGGMLARRASRAATDEWLPTRPEVVKFLGPTTVAHWGTVLFLNFVTVIVFSRFGPATGGVFFIAWQGVQVIDIAAQRFMQSLSAQLARDPENAAKHISDSRKRLLKIFVPVVIVGALLSGVGLRIFGSGYVEAENVLRLLLIGMIFRLFIAHELGVRQALHDGFGFARLQIVSTAFVIAVAGFTPVGAADASGNHPVDQLLPVAVGYVVAQAVVAIFLLVWPRISKKERTNNLADAAL